MNRREFGTGMAALGVFATAPTNSPAASSVEVEKLQLSRNGWMPNNEHLPVLLYRRAFQLSPSAADQMEEAFERNGWPPQWRNGVYDFHHYHSTAHEVLGFAAGSATLILGGEGGHKITVEDGDVAILPAGTGHCRLTANERFLVIGAYPPDQHWDICRQAPDQEAIARMSALAFPESDPISGPKGELTKAWQRP